MPFSQNWKFCQKALLLWFGPCSLTSLLERAFVWYPSGVPTGTSVRHRIQIHPSRKRSTRKTMSQRSSVPYRTPSWLAAQARTPYVLQGGGLRMPGGSRRGGYIGNRLFPGPMLSSPAYWGRFPVAGKKPSFPGSFFSCHNPTPLFIFLIFEFFIFLNFGFLFFQKTNSKKHVSKTIKTNSICFVHNSL